MQKWQCPIYSGTLLSFVWTSIQRNQAYSPTMNPDSSSKKSMDPNFRVWSRIYIQMTRSQIDNLIIHWKIFILFIKAPAWLTLTLNSTDLDLDLESLPWPWPFLGRCNKSPVCFSFNIIEMEFDQNVDIFSYDMLCIPVHHMDIHWAVIIVDFR